MRRRSLLPLRPRHARSSRLIAKVCALAALFVTGTLAAAAAASSAKPSDDCVIAPQVCATLPAPTLPGVSAPNLPTTSTPGSTTTSGGSAPAGTTGTTPASTTAAAEPGAPEQAVAPLTYDVRASVRHSGRRRWIDLRVSLSQAATVVAILQRRDVPAVAAVRGGRAGANAFVVVVPRRVRPGRYALELVLATATERRTVTRTISVPKA